MMLGQLMLIISQILTIAMCLIKKLLKVLTCRIDFCLELIKNGFRMNKSVKNPQVFWLQMKQEKVKN